MMSFESLRSLEAILRGHAKKFSTMDPYFVLDTLILEKMLGEAGETMLKAKVLDVVTECESHPQDLQSQINALLGGQRLKWCRECVRSEVTCAKEMMERMLSSQPVVRSDGASTAWLTRVLKELESYIKYKPGGAGSASSTDKELTGMAALTAKYEKLVKEPPKTLEPLQVFSVWRHLLSAAQAEKVSSWRSALLKSGAAAPAAVKSDSAPVPKRPAKKKGGSVVDDIDSAALALLGLKSS